MEYTITKNAEFGSLEVRFDEKPADTVRLALKRLKMRWHGVNAGTDMQAKPPLSAPFWRMPRKNSPRRSARTDTWAAARCAAARATRAYTARIFRRRFERTSRRQGLRALPSSARAIPAGSPPRPRSAQARRTTSMRRIISRLTVCAGTGYTTGSGLYTLGTSYAVCRSKARRGRGLSCQASPRL